MWELFWIFIKVSLLLLVCAFIYESFYYIKEFILYKKSGYEKISGKSYFDFLKMSRNEKLGFYGEYKTFCILKKYEKESKFISNLYIKDEDNRTTEIDLIMINPKGIFVFESKNVSGYIYGNPEKKYWTQYIGKNNKIELFNPIWQNKKHIQYIYKVLGEEFRGKTTSYIVFSERCKLKATSRYGEFIVLKREYLKTNIDNLIKSQPTIFTNEDIENIYSKLLQNCQITLDEKVKHVIDIKKNIENIKDNYVYLNNDELTTKLKEYRKVKSNELNYKPYFIFNDETLSLLVEKRPKTLEELKSIKGFSTFKIDTYGKDILKIITCKIKKN